MGYWIAFYVLVFLGTILVRAKKLKRGGSIIPHDPRLGILDLGSGEYANIVEGDFNAFSKIFKETVLLALENLQCDILILYSSLGPSGELCGTDRKLREIIAGSGAKIVIVAIDNPAEALGSSPAKLGRANLVITVARCDPFFIQFFSSLFEMMKDGSTMEQAWVKLVPQNRLERHKVAPAAVFVSEVGPVRMYN